MLSLESRAYSYMTRLIGNSCRENGGTRTPNSSDLVCAELARRAGPSPTAAVYITVRPGVVYTLINLEIFGNFSVKVKVIVLSRALLSYLCRGVRSALSWMCLVARWLRSIHFNILTWNGASGAVHICFVPLVFNPILLTASGTPAPQGKPKPKVEELDLFPAQLHSVTDRMGQNGIVVSLSPLNALPEYEKEGEILVDLLERLYQSFLTGGRPNRRLYFQTLI